jgi:hypothetical protein
VDRLFIGILSGLVTAALLRLGLQLAERARFSWAFRPFRGVWRAFTNGPTIIVLTGKEYGHTLKISANEREAASKIQRLLPSGARVSVQVAAGKHVELEGRNIIVLGSERNNETAGVLLRSVSRYLDYEYSADNDLIVNGELFKSEYRDNVLVKDYALVCKASNPYSASWKFIVYAGNHGIGTQGAVHAMTAAEQAGAIFAKVGEADFYAIVETEIDERFGTEPQRIAVVRCGLVGPSEHSRPLTQARSREARLCGLIEDLGGGTWYLGHVRDRARLAVAIARSVEARGRELDIDALYFGAMLHDIGRTVSQHLDHGIKGAEIIGRCRGQLQREFAIMPDTLATILECIECHIVGGIRKEWIEGAQLELPAHDYVPISLEARIVSFADQVLHDWNSAPHVLREAPEYDLEVYKGFYSLTYDIMSALFPGANKGTEKELGS